MIMIINKIKGLRASLITTYYSALREVLEGKHSASVYAHVLLNLQKQ